MKAQTSPVDDRETGSAVTVDQSPKRGRSVLHLLSRAARAGLLSVMLGSLLSAGCAARDQRVAPTAYPQVRSDKAEESQLVDCLLPPQVRQLGRRLTYLSARQAIKTSASDCEIRGGSEQRLSATSLSVS
jgi:hypothetical protein